MLPMEQIFYQVRFLSGRWAAQVTAATKEVPLADQNEMTDWFTGTEKEFALRCDPFNLFFHPLPSGHHALGMIYPVRRSLLSLFQPPQVFNARILLVSPILLVEYNNHPIALFESLRRGHQIPFVSQPPKHLSPIISTASSSPINSSLLDTVVKRLGTMSLAQLMQSLFIAENTLFTSPSVASLSVLSVMFDLLPIPYRPELTFSSDFFFSSKNSFRLSGFSRLQQHTIRLMKQWGVQVIPLERNNKGSLETLDPWARFVYQLLETHNFSFLEQYRNVKNSTAASESQPIIWDNLHEVGVVLSKAMQSGTSPEKFIAATELPNHTLEGLRCVAAVDQILPVLDKPTPDSANPVSKQRLGEQFPQYREELSELETYLVRESFGDDSALPSIKRIWTQLFRQINDKERAPIQEAVIAKIHTLFTTLDGDAEQRLQYRPQLLELMFYFLNR